MPPAKGNSRAPHPPVPAPAGPSTAARIVTFVGFICDAKKRYEIAVTLGYPPFSRAERPPTDLGKPAM